MNIKDIYDDNTKKYFETSASGSKISFKIKATLVIIYLIVVPFIEKMNVPFRPLLAFIWTFLFYGSILYIPTLIGKLLAYKKIKKANAKITSINKDIYLRELPNDYGIGVNTLLMDSKIENNKDIVAVILDLCAKKYLLIEKANGKYVIKVLKNSDNNLLSNEKYILDNIINNNIKNINYKEWFDLCIDDGATLNLYIPSDKKGTFKPVKKYFKDLFKDYSIAMKILLLLIFWPAILGYSFFYLIYRIYFFPVIILNSYNTAMGNNLKRTDKGILEYQKLISFRNFIKDFGAFAGREAKEVVIWDRYLSCAQVFGLTKEIMQTGYNELVNNASFQIDNIDNISLDNIEVLM